MPMASAINQRDWCVTTFLYHRTYTQRQGHQYTNPSPETDHGGEAKTVQQCAILKLQGFSGLCLNESSCTITRTASAGSESRSHEGTQVRFWNHG